MCLIPLVFGNIKINGGPGCPNPPFSNLPLCQLGLLQSACCRQCLCIWVRAQRISQVRVSRRCEIANQHVPCDRLRNQRLCVGHEKEALLDRLVRSRCHNADIAGMTGLTFMAAEFNGKRLELLREFIPGLRRVAIIANPEHPGEEIERRDSEEAGQRLGLGTDFFATRNSKELDDAFTKISTPPVQAISVFADGFAIQNRQKIIEFANDRRVPVISGWAIFAQSGALCTYGPRLAESYRRLAYYVDRILRGADPSTLPIERPTKFELIINARTAKALNIAIPQSVLLRADQVIE